MTAFDDLSDTPCPVCAELAFNDKIQFEAVMPLPKFPALLRQDNRSCCRDCQAAETLMALENAITLFEAARLVIANERCEGLRMPLNMQEHFGLCKLGLIRPCSKNNLKSHFKWLEQHNIGE